MDPTAWVGSMVQAVMAVLYPPPELPPPPTPPRVSSPAPPATASEVKLGTGSPAAEHGETTPQAQPRGVAQGVGDADARLSVADGDSRDSQSRLQEQPCKGLGRFSDCRIQSIPRLRGLAETRLGVAEESLVMRLPERGRVIGRQTAQFSCTVRTAIWLGQSADEDKRRQESGVR